MSGINDPISDLLTRIRNAVRAGQRVVESPASNIRVDIAKILQKRGFIEKFVVIDDGKQGWMKILIRYTDGEPALQGLRRVSTPGRRIYATVDKVPKVLNGLGISIVSTPKGVLTDNECRDAKVGGEVLCKVW